MDECAGVFPWFLVQHPFWNFPQNEFQSQHPVWRMGYTPHLPYGHDDVRGSPPHQVEKWWVFPIENGDFLTCHLKIPMVGADVFPIERLSLFRGRHWLVFGGVSPKWRYVFMVMNSIGIGPITFNKFKKASRTKERENKSEETLPPLLETWLDPPSDYWKKSFLFKTLVHHFSLP